MAASTTADPLLPADSDQFVYSCPCLNVQVTARVPRNADLPDGPAALTGQSREQRVWLGERSEAAKLPAYVSWDQDTFRAGRKQAVESSDPFADELGPSNRTCWICKTKCYNAPGKDQSSPAATDSWVTVDLASGVVWGQELDNLISSAERLPFSSLNLPLSHSTSTFGRPPQTSTPALYPFVGSEDSEPVSLVPPIPDPFFLPPPFIPSHPHLRDLCAAAVNHLNERHTRVEHEVQSFIAQKAREMQRLEDDVRSEVELLWSKYANIPGKKEEIERSRSVSWGRDGLDKDGHRRRESVSRFVPPAINETAPGVNPSSDAALTSPPPSMTGSLLAASLSANSFHAPPPLLFDKVDDSIHSLGHIKNLDDRAVAMSHVFSVLDDAMADRNDKTTRKKKAGPSRAKEEAEQADVEAANELVVDGGSQKDSWIDEERKLLAQNQREGTGENVEDGATPKAPAKDLPEKKTKEKRAVKFEEPKNENKEDSDDNEEEDAEILQSGRDQDEYVFDFELEDGTLANGNRSLSDAEIYHHREKSRTRNMVEDNLSRTFAADAPSHRAAWRRIEQNSSIYASLRRSAHGNDDAESEESGISKLAKSIPLEIVMSRNKQAQPSLPARERKTSFSENGPQLVPPLFAAMRQRGLGENALGLSPSRPTRHDLPRTTHRTASASRDKERDQARSYAADPGAVFETLADDDGEEEDDEDASDEEESGTLKESKVFVPPHVLVRRKDSEGGPEVGWRSLAS